MAVTLATTADLRARAFALIPYIEAMIDAAAVTALLDDCLAESKAELEQALETSWEPKVIRQSTPAIGDSYDLIEEPLPYTRGEFANRNLPVWTLRRRPVVSVQAITLQFADNYVVLNVPDAWMRLDNKRGQLSIMPIGTEALIAQSQGAWFLPLMGQYHPFSYLPQFTAVDYTAGFYDPTADALPENAARIKGGILDAAHLLLLLRSDGIVPTQASAGGASQSFSSMEQRIERMTKRVAEFKTWWGNHYRPPRMMML